MILNQQAIHSKDELTEFLSGHRDISAEVVFIQAKTSRSLEVKEVGNFGWAVADFVSETPQIDWNSIAREKIELLNTLLQNSKHIKDRPRCSLYYVTLAVAAPSKDFNTKVEEIKADIQAENVFSEIKFETLGATELQLRYRKLDQAIEKTFEFQNKIPLPVIPGVSQSYLGIIDALSVVGLITSDEGELLPSVFYDNVRDFQGDVSVNKEIGAALQSSEKEAFAILNNGITIVAETIKTTRNTFTIVNYQIVNGCQTSHVLFANRGQLTSAVQLPIKLLESKNQDLTAKVIRSTNRQTAVQEHDLIAFSDFQKSLEAFYKTFSDGETRLYYERRSKQYNGSGIEKKRIIDKTTQIKAIGSFFFDKPNMATRFFGALFKEFGKALFHENHFCLPYYTAACALYHLDKLFRKGVIDSKYKKIKYFVLMMLRYEINSTAFPDFDNKKVEGRCSDCLAIINNDKKFEKTIKEVIAKIDSLSLNLDDSEISKSKALVGQCRRLYVGEAS